MRTLLILALLGACVGGDEVPDALAPPDLNVYVDLGDRCEPRETHGVVCGNGVPGACVDDLCVPQCSATEYPRCNAPLVARFDALDENTTICYCD